MKSADSCYLTTHTVPAASAAKKRRASSILRHSITQAQTVMFTRSGNRPLPQPPGRDVEQREALWYEHEERMRPSYIQGPDTQASSDQNRGGTMYAAAQQTRGDVRPDLTHTTDSGTLNARRDSKASRMELESTFSRIRPAHLQTTPSRIRPSSLRPYDGADDLRRQQKGSAFLHKGFLDILSLVNNPSSRTTPTGLRGTLSKATARLRKSSNAVPPLRDAFFDGPAPLLTPTTAKQPGVPGAVAGPRPQHAIPTTAQELASTDGSGAPQLGITPGPRAEKKRISTQMVGAPRPESFVHAAHASDAEQAEALLRRWGVEGHGQVADPDWTARCQEALRAQVYRNQAEAVAEVQAALHSVSALEGGPRPLHVANDEPLRSDRTVDDAGLPAAGKVHRQDDGVSEATLRKPLPQSHDTAHPQSPTSNDTILSKKSAKAPISPSKLPQASSQVPAGIQGTVLMTTGTDDRRKMLPDYLQYRPQADDKGTTRLIDGLPGLREEPAEGVKSLLGRYETPNEQTEGPDHVARNLAGEEMSTALAEHAGAAMRPSLTTVEKAVAAKIFFENLYFGILKKPQARETRRAGLEAELAKLRIPDSMKETIRAAWAANETEHLRDIRARVSASSFIKLKTIGHGAFGVVALVKERESGNIFAMKQLRKADMLRKGQEGHIRAERDLMTSASASTMAKWIVKLVYSFQDTDHLYLIMEFMGGGDLLNLLIERDIFEEDFARFYVAEMILAIHEAHKFGYIHRDIKPDNFLFTSQGHIKLADFGLCQSFHWAHDGAYYDQQRKQLLKRHGIDLDDGNISRRGRRISTTGRGVATSATGKAGTALSDKELEHVMSDRNKDGTPQTHVLTWREKNKKKLAYSVVGTNNYMAPEVLRGLGYEQSCDWWSLGVIVFEMLYGFPPFVSKSRHMTRQKILNWKQTLKFPPKPKVSRDAQDFIRKLICEKDDRLGSVATASVSRPNSLLQGSRQRSGFNAPGHTDPSRAALGLSDGVDDLMAHHWFRGIDWGALHNAPAPFVPDLSHAADTKHFEDDIEDEPLPAPGAAEAIKNGLPPPVEEPRDPMLRDKQHGAQLLEMRKQLAFVGYTFKSPKSFNPLNELTDSKIRSAEQIASERAEQQEEADISNAMGMSLQPPMTQSRLRSMSM